MDQEECNGVGDFEEQKSGIVDEVSVLQRKKDILKRVISKFCFGMISVVKDERKRNPKMDCERKITCRH